MSLGNVRTCTFVYVRFVLGFFFLVPLGPLRLIIVSATFPKKMWQNRRLGNY